MYTRLLIVICFFSTLSGTCLSAEDTWYPKSSDSCASFSAEAKTHNWTALAQHPELLWRDKAIFKLKSDYIAALDAISVQIKEGKRHASAEENSIGTLLILQIYCDDHGIARLGDITVSDIFKSLKEENAAPSSANQSEPSIKFPSHTPAEYQNAISKVLPGYEILRNEDFLQDEKWLREFLSPDEIAERKKRKSLGFIEGRFNDDKFPDFAALVINRTIKEARPTEKPESENWKEHFSARLVVCLGTNTPQAYQCEILPTLKGNFIALPYWTDLVVFQTHGEVSCGDIDHQMAAYDMPITALHPEGWNENENSDVVEVPARIIHPNYDAIGEYAIGVNDGRTLVRQADSVYLNCAVAD